MSDVKNNKKKKMLLVIGCVLALIIIVVICIVIASGRDKDEVAPGGVVTVPYEDVIEEDFEIETPYTTLRYPSKWKNEVEIKHVDADNYTVEFYRTKDETEPIHLFDIVFGGETGDFIGSVVNGNNTTDINVVSYSIDNTISNEEYATVSEMLEDVNYIILTLENNEHFKGL